MLNLISCKAANSTRPIGASSKVSHAATAEPTFRHHKFTLRVPAGRRRRGPGFGSIPSVVKSLHQPTALCQDGQRRITSRCNARAGSGVSFHTGDLSTQEQELAPLRRDTETNHHPHSFNLGVPTFQLSDHMPHVRPSRDLFRHKNKRIGATATLCPQLSGPSLGSECSLLVATLGQEQVFHSTQEREHWHKCNVERLAIQEQENWGTGNTLFLGCQVSPPDCLLLRARPGSESSSLVATLWQEQVCSFHMGDLQRQEREHWHKCNVEHLAIQEQENWGTGNTLFFGCQVSPPDCCFAPGWAARAHFSLQHKCFIPHGRPFNTGTGGLAQLQRDTRAYRNPRCFILGVPISQHSELSCIPPGAPFDTKA